MADLITPVVASIFGAVMLLFILGFVILMRRSRPRYGTKDYYQQYQKRDGRKQRDSNTTGSTSSSYASSSNFSYSSRWDRASERASQYSSEEAAGQRRIAAIVIILAIAAIAISTYFQAIEGLLIIFTLPIIVRFLRARRFNNRRRASPDGGDSRSI